MRSAFTLAALLAGSVAFAQSERYELGARLKAFEAEWDRQTDKDARKRALKDLPQVTQQFFSFQFGKAGQTLDNARFSLMSDKPPSDAVLWATSLYPEVKLRLVSNSEIEVNVKQFYTVKAEKPKGVSVRAAYRSKSMVWATAVVEKLPVKLTVKRIPLETPTSLTLVVEVVSDGKVLATRYVDVGVFGDRDWERLDEVRETLVKGKEVTFERATFKERLSLLRDLQNGTIPESDIPAAAILLQTTRQLLDNKDFTFGPGETGDLRVSVPTGENGKTVTPCRLFVPQKLDPKKPVPLVVAMHGTGGSENLFFEGYGNGHIVKLCEERGWLLVSPRAGLGFGLTAGPPVGDIVVELAKRYPVDTKRVFIVGHSMGSSMAFDAVQKYPGKFAAVAGLGGGGTVRKADVFAELPVFIGVGDKDFAVRTAKSLHSALEKGQATKVTFKEYPDVEHLVIVREALGDVFDLFDKVK